jgi:hypothetical protein
MRRGMSCPPPPPHPPEPPPLSAGSATTSTTSPPRSPPPPRRLFCLPVLPRQIPCCLAFHALSLPSRRALCHGRRWIRHPRHRTPVDLASLSSVSPNSLSPTLVYAGSSMVGIVVSVVILITDVMVIVTPCVMVLLILL